MTRLPNYEIVESLHAGRLSRVWRALRYPDRQPVILKRLAEDYPSPERQASFEQEYRISRHLDLPAVVQVHSLERCQDTLVLVLEDFGGQSLDRILKGATLSFEQRLRLSIQAAEILHQVHARGVIHRDINLSNFIWNRATDQLKLADFGLALRLPEDLPAFRHPDRIEGTLAYIAPEQTGRMNRTVDCRTDLYSFGAMLYEVFTGRPPFDIEDTLELVHAHLAREPQPPQLVEPSVPPALSAIILKLLRKDKEERYQTAQGVQADLEHGWAQWEATRAIAEFPLGRHDVSDQFHVPNKLYGREAELDLLLGAYDRASQGAAEIMLVAGFSGVGKSSLVHEIYQPITKKHGYFATGKFNQYQQTIPYAAFRRAFDGLCHYLLAEGDAARQQWQERFRETFGGHGQVLVDVIPALELIVGPQPPVDAINPQEAQIRFHSLFRGFLRAICRPEHPLALFMDDWQWADTASIRLLHQIATDPDLRHLLVVCAYRDNEVDATHPFLMAVEELRRQQATLHRIEVPNLRPADLGAWIADTVQQPAEAVCELVQLVQAKTLGNPFFARLFLRTLHEHQALAFDPQSRRWRWDPARIQAQGLADNVVDLLLSKIRQLPPATQRLLPLAAAVGDRFELQTLAIISRTIPAEALEALWPAVTEGLIIPLNDHYLLLNPPGHASQAWFLFQHDRVQQAAYALVPAAEKPSVHFSIGQLLLRELDAVQRAERLFELVDHLNLGRSLVTGLEERVQAVRLNCEAARKAMTATAYQAALQYHQAAFAFLNSAEFSNYVWAEHHELAVTLFKESAETEYLNGNFERAEALVREAVPRTRTPLETADLLHGLIVQFTLLARYPEAIATGRQALAALGIELPENHYEAARDAEMRSVKDTIGQRPIASLFDLPEMSDPVMRMAVKLLITMGPPCYRSHQRLWAVIVPKVVNTCLHYGNLPQVGYSHTAFGGLLGWAANDYATAVQFGEVATRLMTETFRSPPDQSVFYLMIGSSLRHWSQPLRHATADYLDAYNIGLRASNLQYAAYAFGHNMYCRFFQGVPLDQLLPETEKYLHFSQTRRNQWAIDLLEGGQMVFGTLSGSEPVAFRKGALTEAEYLARCEAHHNIQVTCIYHVLKSYALYTLGRLEEARETLQHADALIYTVGTQGLLPWPEHVFCQSLVLSASCAHASADRGAEWRPQLEANLRQLQLWAKQCPENFEHKYLLAAAEWARLEDRHWEALDLYDRAIAAARDQGFVQHQGAACECAARLWLDCGKAHLAQPYLRQAHHAYTRWQAGAKLRQFAATYAEWLPAELDPAKRASATERLGLARAVDLDTLVTAAQTLSETVQLESLLKKMMRLVMANAGADAGRLLLPAGDTWLIEAQATLQEMTVLQALPMSDDRVPVALLQYTGRTGQPLIANQPADLPQYARDAYLQQRHPKSLCCLPLLNRGTLIGILYLENNLTQGVFTEDKVELLRLLSVSMASAIVNAQLYDNLEKTVLDRTAQLRASERDYRSLYDNSPLSLWVEDLSAVKQEVDAWKDQGIQNFHDYLTAHPEAADHCVRLIRLISVNQATLSLYGARHLEDLQQHLPLVIGDASRVVVADLLHAIAANAGAFELEAVNHTLAGAPLHVAIRGAVMPGCESSFARVLLTIQDLTARKKAEAEQAEMRLQLQQAQKLESVGRLAAGIAHEINTPIQYIGDNTRFLQDAFGSLLQLLGDFHGLRQACAQKAVTAELLLTFDAAVEKHDADFLAAEVPKAIQQSLEGVERVAKIVLAMKEFSHPGAAEKSAVNLNQAIQSTVTVARNEWKYVADLELDLEPSLPAVHCLPGELNQVFLNLVINAAHAIGEVVGDDHRSKGTITVSTRREGDWVEVRVRDTGKGIPAAIRHRLFEPFFTTKPVGKGTGQGLAIARSVIMDKHGGTLDFESEEGRGTTFIIRLPLGPRAVNQNRQAA